MTFTAAPSATLAQRTSRRGLAVTGLVLALALAACSSSKPKPSPLESFTPSVKWSVSWSQRLSSNDGLISLALRNGTVTTASTDGDVAQLDVATGRVLWRTDVRDKLTAAVGSDGRYAAVVTEGNELLALDQGKVIWRERLPGRVLTAPLVAGERVFIQALDRSVRAYDVQDGRWLWQYQRPGGEPLALASVGVISAFRDTLVVGQGTRLTGLDPVKGTVRFDTNVGTPRGTNEVERLADLVGPLARLDEQACVRSFQLSVSCLDLNRGSLRWSRTQAGTQAVAAGTSGVFAADASDRLSAWKADNGDFMWRVDRFANRGLSAPAVLGDRVAVVDRDGYAHLLAAADGRTLARLELDAGLAGAPVVSGDTLLAVTRRGTVYALRSN